MDFIALASTCAPEVSADLLYRIASVESAFNPYAIGVVGGRLERQPRNLDEAIATASRLEADGHNYSLGLVQINRKNFKAMGLDQVKAFDPCTNLHAGARIYLDCYRRAASASAGSQRVRDALSCYNTGSMTAGYSLGYVAKVVTAGSYHATIQPAQPIPFAATHATGPAKRETRPAGRTILSAPSMSQSSQPMPQPAIAPVAADGASLARPPAQAGPLGTNAPMPGSPDQAPGALPSTALLF